MDPDIPAPSIEYDAQPVSARTNKFNSFRDNSDSPLVSSSPNRTPFKTPFSHPNTPAPDKSSRSPSVSKNGRQSTPGLLSQRSSSSLSLSRGQTPSQSQLRRVSSNLNPASPTINMKPQEALPPPPMTAELVAEEYFRRELEAHAKAQSKTAVIVHDSCYGHRFSRPRASKAALATIVERPERILATLLGASLAYVRLGQRHADGGYSPHPGTDISSLPPPPFLLKKTSRSIALNNPAVTHLHGAKWMEELQIMCDSAEAKLAMSGKELQRPIGYNKDEDGNPLPSLHEGDLYLCSESLAALQGCLGGVCDAVDAVFSTSMTSRAFVCIRPPGHHCSSNYPSGFCWLNNVHVGISYAAMNHGLTHAAIIDFDLHHGDGSQMIAWDHNRKAQSLPKNAAQHKKTPIGYYSLHDINSYPCEWGDEEKVRNASLCIENAHGQSIWNVHLEPWKSLEHFWQLYETKYAILLEKTKSFLRSNSQKLRAQGIQPRAAIFISAGFDASQWEGQGMQRHDVNVPTEFYARFTSDIVKLAAEAELGVDDRVISVLEGGYSDRALTSGVLSHLCGLTAHDFDTTTKSSASEWATNGLGMSFVDPAIGASIAPYDPEWWNEANLAALNDRVQGKIPVLPSKKDKAPGNYSSPTQASTARMTDVARERRSFSSQLDIHLLPETTNSGPPPPVDWITAAYQLSRMLIPSDRQTLSCRHDELNAGATKARRERQSTIGVAAPPEKRMQLRTRGKGPIGEAEVVRAISRTSNRRTTIAAVSELPDPSMPSQRPSRRSSAASSILSSFQDMKINDDGEANIKRPTILQQTPSASDPAKELVVKKTRMGPPTKKTAARISSPRKAKENLKSTAKKITPLQDKLNSARAVAGKPGSVNASQPMQTSNEMPTQKDAVDDLAGSMKKISIKLKMPTPEQHVENQRRAEEYQAKQTLASKQLPPPTVHSRNSVETLEHLDADDRTPSAQIEPIDNTGAFKMVPAQSHASTEDQRSMQRRSLASAPIVHHGSSDYDARLVRDAAAVSPQTANEHGGINDESNMVPSKGKARQSLRPFLLPIFTSNSQIPFSDQQTMNASAKAPAAEELGLDQPQDSSPIGEIPPTRQR